MPKIFYVPQWLLFGNYGATLPFGVVLVAKGDYDKKYVIEHEKVHLEQIAKECCYLVWIYKYVKQLIKFGYRDMPYEVEARQLGAERSK